MPPKPKGPAAAIPKRPSVKAKASPKSSLIAAAKGVIGGDMERAAPAPAPLVSTSVRNAPVPVLSPLACASYDGKPLDVNSAEALLVAISIEEMRCLAESTNFGEQLPARMLLELVGDKDLSWGNAMKSLKDGASFKKEILDMEGASYVTRKSIERFEALGSLQPKDLQGKSVAAFAMAVYVEAVIWAAKEKLGMNETPGPAAPVADEQPPAWPIMVGIKEIPAALAEARKWQRTPLFLCSGKVATVDAFFTYQSCSLVDAKWILNKVDVKKELDVSQMREQIRSRLVSALKFGQPIHISMSNSAVALKSKYCSEAEFPEALFKNELWFQKDVYSQIVRETDLIDWPGAFPGKMKGVESYSFVTSDFNLESAREFLPAVLPYFDDMAIIQIDPATINA